MSSDGAYCNALLLDHWSVRQIVKTSLVGSVQLRRSVRVFYDFLLPQVGVYGVVTVRWSLRLDDGSADGAPGEVVGVSPTSGVEVFQDGVDHVHILLLPLPGGRPRPVQVCAAVLSSASGGALLPDPSDISLLLEQRIVIADSGSAYGIVDLVPDNCSLIVVPTNVHYTIKLRIKAGSPISAGYPSNVGFFVKCANKRRERLLEVLQYTCAY